MKLLTDGVGMRLGSISACAGVMLGHLVLGQPAAAQTPPSPASVPAAPVASASDPQAVLAQAVGEMQRALAAGNRPEMLRIAERTYERLKTEAGAEHPMTAVALFNVGAAQRQAGANDEAAATLQRALALESKLGSPARDTFRRVLRELSDVERGRGRAQAVISIYDTVIEQLRKESAGSLAEAELLEEQAQLMRHTGAFTVAGERLETALAIKQAKLPPNDMGIVSTLTHLAGIARLTGKPAEAESHYKRGIAIVTSARGERNADLAILVDNLGVLYQSIGRDADAEVQHKRALAIFEETVGREHLNTAHCVANLAAVNFKLGRFAEAEPLSARALAIYRAKLPPGDWRIGVALDNLAGIWRSQKRYAEAARGYEQASAILRKAYSDTHPAVGTALNNLAVMYSETGKLSEAEKAAGEALAIVEKAQGSAHNDVAYILNTRGSVYADQGRLPEARADYERSVSIIEKAVGADHPLLVMPLSAIGQLQLAAGDASGAIATFQRAARIESKDRARGALRVHRPGKSTPKPFVGLVAALWQQEQQEAGERSPAKGAAKAATRADEALFQAQWALESEAGKAVAQLGARLGTRNPALAALARERQDLTEEWTRSDQALTALMAKPGTQRRDGDDAALRQRLGEIDARLERIDASLIKDHPGFVEIALPRPLASKELRAVLRADEALLAYLPAEKHVYAWLVTRHETTWQRIELPLSELERKVRTLRCGLDASEWWDEARSKRCTELTGGKASESVLPFDAPTSVELHKALIAPFASALEGKHILLAAGGALSSLPLQVLMPEVPKDGGLAKAKWLGLRHPMTTLPSIASLKSLRRDARTSAAPRPYIGIGNPLLIGPNREYSAAWGAQSCLASSLKKPRTGRPLAVVSDARSRGRLVRGGTIDVEQVRLLSPLPETRDEICAVWSSVGGGEQDLAMGSKASEKNLRDLNASGALRSYKVVHFATHGLIAGEVPGLTEAALVLTPPADAKPDDDGLLTASEIATFRLDADWVILSACNTAAGDGLGAETLSGLARAFFHAGARSLLVSHWPVQSDAAVKLTTRALAELKKSPGLARSEALRRSMAALVADPSIPGSGHPQVWAPFVVAGEGGGGLAASPVATAPASQAQAAVRTQSASEIVPAAAVAAGAAAAGAAAAAPSPKAGEAKAWVAPWAKRQAAPAPAAKAAPAAPAAATPAVVPKTSPAAGPAATAPPRPTAPTTGAQPPVAKVVAPTPSGIKPLPASPPQATAAQAAAKAGPAAAAKAPAAAPPPAAPSPAPVPKPQPQKSLSDEIFR